MTRTHGRTTTLENIEAIEINIEDAINALQKNWQNETQRGELVLRVTPPFEGVSEAHTHYSEPNRYYGGDPPWPLHIKPECVVTGHEDGENSYGWEKQYNFPCEMESKSLYEEEANDDEDWEDWWDVRISFWEDEIRRAMKTTDTITFRNPDRFDDTINIPVEFKEGSE